MTRTIPVALVVFLLVAFAPVSSAKPLPLEAPDPGRGIIGVRIKVIPPARMGWSSADAVYFVRVAEDADRFGAEGVINSNYTKGGHVYLLNAKPGRYVAVGCEFVLGTAGATAKAVFPKADILQSEVEVTAGSTVFMGEITAQTSTKTQESDEAETHYLHMIAPAAANKGFLARALTGAYVYTAAFKSIARDQSVSAEFWGEAVEKHFKNDPFWSSRIARRSTSPAGAVPTAEAAAAPPEAIDKKAAAPPGGLAVHPTGNIPDERLDRHTYTSPDGGFELTLPPLITPGAKAEERQLAEGTGVFFADDLGNMYYVVRTDNTQLKYDLDKVAAGYTINESLREKQIVPTARGSELRLAGVMPAGSPIAEERKVDGKSTLQKLDLHQAMSLFVSDAYIYEVAAGVTATHQQSDAEMLARAKEHLDAFLGGLRIRSAAAPSN